MYRVEQVEWTVVKRSGMDVSTGSHGIIDLVLDPPYRNATDFLMDCLLRKGGFAQLSTTRQKLGVFMTRYGSTLTCINSSSVTVNGNPSRSSEYPGNERNLQL